MALTNTWGIDYTYKRIYWSSGTAVDTVRDLYRWLMDQFDESTAMDDTVPMSAQTPTDFTMINGWYVDEESIKTLKGGSIKSVGYDAGTYTYGIRLLKLGAGWDTLSSGDLGKTVTYSGGSPSDSGRLVGYNNTLKYMWVRVDDTGDTFANTGTAIIIDAAGTPIDQGNLLEASGTGEVLWSNVYTLGTIPTDPYPQIYIFQGGASLSEWWSTGHVDILVKVKETGNLIDSGNVTVFCRQNGDLYDNFTIDLSGAGRNPVPLAASTDLNNTTPSHFLLYDGETGGGFSAGDTIRNYTTGYGTFKAEIVSIEDWGTAGMLRLRNVTEGDLADDDDLYVSGTKRGDANGTLGDCYLEYDNESGGSFAVTNIITGQTSGAKRELVGLQDDGTDGKMVLKASEVYDDDPDYYTEYQITPTEETFDNGSGVSADVDIVVEYAVSGYGDILVAFVNGTLTVDDTTGAVVGKTVTGGTSGDTGVILAVLSSTELLLGNCTGTFHSSTEEITDNDTFAADTASPYELVEGNEVDKNFTKSPVNQYNVVVDLNGRTVLEMYEYQKFLCQENSAFQCYTCNGTTITPLDGEEYEKALAAYTTVKAAPFGTFAGGVYFGARGVWIEDMADSDIRNFQLIDSDGDTNNPPNQQTITVSNLSNNDRVAVFRDDGTGNVNKLQYTSHASNNGSGSSTFEVQENISNDTPPSGILRMRKATGVEERIAYTSWSGKIFALGSAHGGGYDDTSTAYVPFIDTTATGSSVSVNTIYIGDVDIIVRVRRYTAPPIIPFETTGTFGSTGVTIGAIRTDDTIAAT